MFPHRDRDEGEVLSPGCTYPPATRTTGPRAPTRLRHTRRFLTTRSQCERPALPELTWCFWFFFLSFFALCFYRTTGGRPSRTPPTWLNHIFGASAPLVGRSRASPGGPPCVCVLLFFFFFSGGRGLPSRASPSVCPPVERRAAAAAAAV